MKCSGCLIGCLQFFRLSVTSLWEWLIDHDVVPGKMMCRKCQQPAKFLFYDFSFRCWRPRIVRKGSRMVKVQCTFHQSARKGSWLGNSLSSVIDIAHFCSLWLCTSYPKTVKLKRITGFTSLTVGNWTSACRETCISWASNPARRVGGQGTVVEVAEAKFGEKRYSLGRKKDVCWVIGGIQRGSSKIFLVHVDKQGKETLRRVLSENVLPGTSVINNCSNVYGTPSEQDSEQSDENHGLQFVLSNNSDADTRNAQRMLRRLRKFVPKGRKREQFQGYLAEYVFRQAYRPKERLHHFFVEASKVGSSRGSMIA
ncbi:uncharacterized protein LOC126162763 [Schistocerca cancellata]|uniref:uncharacterized protein LOC126162763 n=1 Tax=Schistocerca cancellata TaxID=274614 RepID=UPI0021178AAE|nr:uncharacterized protein LOC126162763 [Schistocerca cancellata]